ncbi:MAG: 5'/3'-nucleotidase SurE [Clostridiaceae bacterium]|nr:5'/3'-nucleotidase SurE [Eubacteriales bacterium]
MRILLSNDDGLFSPGIRALAEFFCAEHEVCMAAPDTERSGASHSFTFSSPLRMNEVRLDGLENVPAYAISGTPVDCVKIGLATLGAMPDLVISGINIGANLGTDTFYSGTVSAAMEAALLGIPAIAVSVCSFQPKHLATAALAAQQAMAYLKNCGSSLLNVNVPDLPANEIKGIKVTRLSKQVYATAFIERTDPHMRKYYWMPSERLTKCEPEEDSDERWTREGYVALTPLLTDLTDFNSLRAF